MRQRLTDLQNAGQRVIDFVLIERTIHMNDHKGILLESGTNELEIVEFQVGSSKFGINVIKVKEIIQPIPVTFIPHAHPHVEGIVQLRGEVLPVVSMAKVLGLPEVNKNEPRKIYRN